MEHLMDIKKIFELKLLVVDMIDRGNEEKKCAVLNESAK